MMVVRGVTKSGSVVFYTGKAGEAWVSTDMSDAFPYSESGARAKASMFNRMTEIHGIHFIAYDTERANDPGTED